MALPNVQTTEKFLPVHRLKVIRSQKEGGKSQNRATFEPDILLEDLLEQYLNDYSYHDKFRERTIKDYLNHLRYLKKWATEEGYVIRVIGDLTEELIHEYRFFLIEQYAQHTVNIRLSTLKAFLGWAYERGYLPIGLHSKLDKVKVDYDQIRFFTDEQVRSLLMVPNIQTFIGLRNYCMMLVMLDTGMRVKELVLIHWDDVDFQNSEIRLTGHKTKTRKFRKVPMSPETVGFLKQLKKVCQQYFPGVEHVFVSDRGNPMDTSSVRHFLRDYGKKAGIDGQCSPHMLRHTFARSYVLQGANVFDLQEVLGHTTLEMSRKYVRYFSNDIARNHKKFSPVRRIFR
ncbi:tyrosine-type recombinase/integrase [Effusibacillus pohliae]|uniref:tyrosine-type recombinase/integrase n=1 Tax=Effusibacillus pohliae TaxID=232270 RepID=UPI00037E84E5|nr:tyrosine-type recombinase/integrase [Effusibacillus pohliae]